MSFLQTRPIKVGRATGPRSWMATATGRTIVTSVFIIAVALVTAIILIQMQGYEAFGTLGAGLQYALGSGTSIARTLAWGLPLYVAALGVAIAFRSGMFNIGAEGQVYAGALAAALAGAYLGPMFTGLHLVVATAAAAIAGGAIAAGLGWLRAAWDVDEVLSTLLSNYIIILFTTYLATGPLRDPSRQSGTTKEIFDTARFTEIFPRTGFTWAIIVVILACVGTWWLSERTIVGYRWRMTGESPGFATAVGINVKRSRILSMMTSGALAGIGGSLLVTASQGRFWTEIGSGIGWDAVLIALIARARPIPTIVWVTIYCVMRATARGIEQVSTVPSELSLILISVIIVAAAAKSGLFARIASLQARFTGTKGR